MTKEKLDFLDEGFGKIDDIFDLVAEVRRLQNEIGKRIDNPLIEKFCPPVNDCPGKKDFRDCQKCWRKWLDGDKNAVV